MKTNLGAVRLHFLYYDTPAEMHTLLRQLEAKSDADPLVSGSVIVLAIPDKLRKFLGWSRTAPPRPELHGDAIVFQRGTP